MSDAAAPTRTYDGITDDDIARHAPGPWAQRHRDGRELPGGVQRVIAKRAAAAAARES